VTEEKTQTRREYITTTKETETLGVATAVIAIIMLLVGALITYLLFGKKTK